MTSRPAAAPRNLALVAGAAAVAAGLGFGVAKITSPPPPAATAAAPAAAAGPAELALDAAYLKASNIVVQPATAGDFGGQVLGSGSVVATPNGEAVLTARAAGALVRLYKRLGDPVKAGEPLALIESRDAAMVAAQRGTAEARAVLARSNLAREKRLFEQGVTSRQDYETAQAEAAAANAEAAGARAAAGAAKVSSDGRGVTVSSPIAGRITAASATLGAFVQPETELFRVADPRDVQVEAAVSPQDAARIQAGAAAKVRTSTGVEIAATVRSVTPTLSPETRTATVVLSVSGAGLTPGEAVQVQIQGQGTGQSGFILPEDAVQRVDGREVVFVRTAKGFAVRPVAVASRSGGQAMISSGLRAGDMVATRNAFLLKAELGKGGEEEE
jgi:cobalt-zinc-cadmium efflux system membrane fusion protein